MTTFFAAAATSSFASNLQHMFWLAYGKPIKFVFWTILIILLVFPAIAIIKQLTR